MKNNSSKEVAGQDGFWQGEIKIGGKMTGYVNISPKVAIEVPAERLYTALHRDIVRVRKTGGTSLRGNALGEVVDIISRYKTRFVGEVAREGDIFYLIPDHPKMYVDLLLEEGASALPHLGKKVLVEITSWGGPHHGPAAKIVQVIGEPGLHETEMEAIVLDRGIIEAFPEELEKEARQLHTLVTEEEKKKRRDFRGIPTFTIDPADAKDFDDALSVQEVDDGIEVGIHIADVSYFLREGTALNKEGRDRGTSVYLVDRTLPMLPETLSNDLCSLKADEDKFTFSAIFVLSPEGEVVREWFGRTVIHSKKRFTYEEAQEVLDTGKGVFLKELTTLNTLAKKMRKAREDTGAIVFDDVEVKFVLGESGHPLEIYKKERKDTNRLVEDFMLLANKRVALFVSKKKKGGTGPVFVYRIHDKPDQEKIANLITFLRSLGHKADLDPKHPKPQDINRLLDTVVGKPEEHLVERATIKSMSKAIYSTKNIGHFGLAFDFYTHFTSPIRRYPDVLVHRYLARYLADEKIPEEERDALEGELLHASSREVLAQEAERDSVKYKQIEYMSTRIGETFTGIVSGVTDWGFFVEDVATRAEGLVRARDLTDDFYTYDEKTETLVGQKNGRRFRLGDTVKFTVAETDIKRRQMTYRLAI